MSGESQDTVLLLHTTFQACPADHSSISSSRSLIDLPGISADTTHRHQYTGLSLTASHTGPGFWYVLPPKTQKSRVEFQRVARWSVYRRLSIWYCRQCRQSRWVFRETPACMPTFSGSVTSDSHSHAVRLAVGRLRFGTAILSMCSRWSTMLSLSISDTMTVEMPSSLSAYESHVPKTGFGRWNSMLHKQLYANQEWMKTIMKRTLWRFLSCREVGRKEKPFSHRIWLEFSTKLYMGHRKSCCKLDIKIHHLPDF